MPFDLIVLGNHCMERINSCVAFQFRISTGIFYNYICEYVTCGA